MRSSRLRCCRASAEATFHNSLNFLEFFFIESAFNNEKPVDVPKSGVIIVDSCDKRNAVAEFRFDLLKGFSCYLP